MADAEKNFERESAKTFQNCGFLNLEGMDLQKVMGYQSVEKCDRTSESDHQAVNKDTTVFLSTDRYAKELGITDGKGLYWTDDMN